MITWFQTASRWVLAASTACTLAACGGGGGGGGETVPPAPAATTFSASAATEARFTIFNAPIANISTAGVPAVSALELFKWAELWSGDTKYGLFPGDPPVQTGTFDGDEFTYKSYSTGHSIRIRKKDGMIFVWWADKGVQQVGTLAHYACVIHNCADPSTAGRLRFAGEGGTSVTIIPNYKGEKVTWVGRDNKGHEIPVSEIEQVCFRSDRLLNWGERGGIGCAKPADNGDLRIPIPSNACGRFTLWTKAGQEYWLDLEHARGWHAEGLNAKRAACGIEYGENGFKPSVIHAVRESDGTASLIFDFGSDFLGGFFGADGKPIRFDTRHGGPVYVFALNGNRQGEGYQSGWGLGIGRKTKEGHDIAPSIRRAWLTYDQGRFFVRFTNLACTDKVNVTAYQGTGATDQVKYDFGKDGFGLGWAGLPYQKNPSVWTAGSGVRFDTSTGQVEYGVPFCKEK